MTTTNNDSLRTSPSTRTRALWPLWGLPAGLLGFIATVFLNARPPAESKTDGYTVTPDDMPTLDVGSYHLAVVLGYISVMCLLVFAAEWRRRVERRFEHSTGAAVVTLGLVASAGGLTLAYGWMGALSRYLPSAPEGSTYDNQGTFVYFMLTDFSPYIAWLGVLLAGGALAWMAFRERLVSRALGAFTGAVFVAILAFVFITGVPGAPGIAGLVWAIASVWLALGRSAVTRTSDA
ncbi:hypothetical protein GCM10009795_005400 [Nocardioides hankookensis]|uniref:DUF4386 family protein n=1 Tax=Nocardioides hankookensis TaxID=443157 RepID=A0ABW1LHX4_9ACTN